MMASNPLKVCEKLFFDAPQIPFTRSFGSWRKSLQRLRYEVERRWRKWLDRRSWRGRMTWERFGRLRKTFPLPQARVVHSVYRCVASP